MGAITEDIRGFLEAVQRERLARAADPRLALRVAAVKEWQRARFGEAYADFQRDSRYSAAIRFFLEDLYGPVDFTARDRDFARVVPTLVRLFPTDVVRVVRSLGELHALSEAFDTAMGSCVGPAVLGERDYAKAWKTVGRYEDRLRQLELTLGVGGALDRLTASRTLRHTLRLMRAPARAAGLAALQVFLERGFDAFRAMHGAKDFLGAVRARETDFIERMAAAPGNP